MAENLYAYFNNGKTTLPGLEKSLSLLKGVLDYGSFEGVDLVVEVVKLGIITTSEFRLPGFSFYMQKLHEIYML